MKQKESEKLTLAEMAEYYIDVHHDSIARCQDPLDSVITPGGHPWINSFRDYAHRLSMKKAFRYLEGQWGSLSGRAILDVGCGRGRWVKEYASRGARVTGVDISPEAIALLERDYPGHTFFCEDLSRLALPKETFDGVNSVTVLQHLPQEGQVAALNALADSLKRGGYLVLLENTYDFAASIVFPHRPEEWAARAKSLGLQLRCSWPSNFEVLIRAAAGLVKSSERSPGPGAAAAGAVRRRLGPGPVAFALKGAIALSSYPTEWLLSKLPVMTATHRLMIFQKVILPLDASHVRCVYGAL